jgi:hypothetical protein
LHHEQNSLVVSDEDHVQMIGVATRGTRLPVLHVALHFGVQVGGHFVPVDETFLEKKNKKKKNNATRARFSRSFHTPLRPVFARLTHSVNVPRHDFAAFIASGTVRFVSWSSSEQFLNRSWCIALPLRIASENNLASTSWVGDVNIHFKRTLDLCTFFAISSAMMVHALLPSKSVTKL